MTDAGPGRSRRWDDLAPRLLTGAAIAFLGIAAIWLGGPAFRIFTVVAASIMVWELARMTVPATFALPLALAAGAALAAAEALPAGIALPLLMLPAIAGLAPTSGRKMAFAIFALMILIAAYGLFDLRESHGFLWIFWLISVVVATDVVGYFAGRAIGGPRFWPRVSPKKTWSGTAAGWIAAGCLGWVFARASGSGAELIGVSVAVSMASQIGDMAESALKRSAGVKDSSALLPGHGGLFDRFDGMLGASVFLLLTGDLVGIPPGSG